ncbi:MAG TPA: glycosyltransferase family 4 protein [Gaiellaceae bacterium]|nr:glycosyltransferase family 4 protein [Gaiellaceae bacterium]
MRVAVISPPWFAVPPAKYGGIEWVVALLADGLVDAGHRVTLFASGGSRTNAELATVFAEPPSGEIGRTLPELHHALACFERAEEFDVINDHSGPLAAALGATVRTPVVHTVHGPLAFRSGVLYEQVARVAPRVGLVSVSLNQRKPRPHLPWVANCPNALDLSAYPVHPHTGDYLLFLGRLSPDKGAHRAIEVARSVGVPLKIAGKMQDTVEQAYFDSQIRPHVGPDIEYVGEVTHDQKVDLLQNARATLFPIKWEEPFGLVMVESMACGTPVIATRWGAVPEVIDHGRSGIVVDEHTEMGAALALADELDPIECRRYVEERFSAERMVRDYEAAYASVVDARGREPLIVAAEEDERVVEEL